MAARKVPDGKAAPVTQDEAESRLTVVLGTVGSNQPLEDRVQHGGDERSEDRLGEQPTPVAEADQDDDRSDERDQLGRADKHVLEPRPAG